MATGAAAARHMLDAAMQKYIAALNALDEQQFVLCFRANCVIRDPYGMSLYEGVAGVQQYFQAMAGTWQAFTLTPGKVYYGGEERVAFSWTVHATAINGKTTAYEGINVMTLEGDLIDGLESYWDAAAMYEQIKD